MKELFYIGYCFFLVSTFGFIIAIINPFWIKIKIDSLYVIRGIFEICELNQGQRICSYIFLYSDSELIKAYRTRNYNLIYF